MIPKIIHFCWLSDDEYPEKIKKCLQSWKEKCPDYDIKKWDFSSFPIGKSNWVDEAFNAKKYAFAADYLRCYALYTEGGIYLDSDVEVLKNFDDLLDLPYFIGKENDGGIEAAIVGAEKGMLLFKKMLEYYDSRHFFIGDGIYDIIPMPQIFYSIINQNYKIEYVKRPNNEYEKKDILYVLPYDYFSPKSYETGKLKVSKNTYTIHHFTGSWIDNRVKLKKKFIKLIGPSLTKIAVKIKSIIGSEKF